MGAYDLLMDWLYANEKPIPNAPEKFHRIARATTKAERANVVSVLNDLFDLTDDGYVQKRVMEEIEHSGEISESARKSAHARWGKPQCETHAKRMRNASETQSVRNASHYSITPIAIEQDQKQGRASAPKLPEWLPDSTWNDWHNFRNARKGWTTKARELSLRTLGELRAAGHDPRAVIEQSIERGWTGLFPIRQQDTRGSPKPPIAQQFGDKTYTGTPDDELPEHLRPLA